jgi:hypothetical protein
VADQQRLLPRRHQIDGADEAVESAREQTDRRERRLRPRAARHDDRGMAVWAVPERQPPVIASQELERALYEGRRAAPAVKFEDRNVEIDLARPAVLRVGGARDARVGGRHQRREDGEVRGCLRRRHSAAGQLFDHLAEPVAEAAVAAGGNV